MAQATTGAPALPVGLVAQGPMHAFTPHGTVFARAVTITVPFSAAAMPAGTTPQFCKTNAQNLWEPVANAVFGAGSVSADVTGFSFVQIVAVPALQRNDPLRIWAFSTYPANGLGRAPVVLPNGKANGFVFSSADGVTYLVSAEAPYNADVRGPGPVGSRTRLQQFQSFVKRSDAARLSFTITRVELMAEDYNTRADLSKLIRSEVLLNVQAYRTTANYFFVSTGRASVSGRGSLYVPDVRNESWSTRDLWGIDDFDMSTTDVSCTLGNGSCPGKRGRLVLKAPVTRTIDLSSVAVGESFTLPGAHETAAAAAAARRRFRAASQLPRVERRSRHAAIRRAGLRHRRAGRRRATRHRHAQRRQPRSGHGHAHDGRRHGSGRHRLHGVAHHRTLRRR